MTSKILPPPLRQTANPVPVRSNGSVRRTTSIDVSWPDGLDGDRQMIGRARDYLTPPSGGPGRVLAEGEFIARLDEDKTITAITANPAPGNIATLVGERGGGHLRLVLQERMPGLIASGDPLYLALDDISGTSLVSAFAWSQWHPDWSHAIRRDMSAAEFEKLMASRANICWGLAEGNSGLQPGGPPNPVAEADAGDLRNPADPYGWHELYDAEGPGFRRARRIDVSRDSESGLIRVASSFQDSASTKDGGRVAIHEYNLDAVIDPASLEIRAITATPHILPFSECPGVIGSAQRMVGKRITDIRTEVLAQLRGTAGCTHLNDALRALAEVPLLADRLVEPA